jgi:hypothetical protein
MMNVLSTVPALLAGVSILMMTACLDYNAKLAGNIEPFPEDEEEEVQAAALAWVIARADTDLDPPAAYCIALDDDYSSGRRDPSATLLARLHTAVAPARPISECRFGGPLGDGSRYDDSRHVVIDRTTQRFALYFGVSVVRWDAGGVAEVDVHYLQGGLWGGGYECRAEREGRGPWRVTTCLRTYDV